MLKNHSSQTPNLVFPMKYKAWTVFSNTVQGYAFSRKMIKDFCLLKYKTNMHTFDTMIDC